MTLETVRAMLAWCSVINIGFLALWILLFMTAHEWMYQMHGKWFSMSKETFNAIHYGGMGLFKIGILLLNLAPYLALRIVG